MLYKPALFKLLYVINLIDTGTTIYIYIYIYRNGTHCHKTYLYNILCLIWFFYHTHQCHLLPTITVCTNILLLWNKNRHHMLTISEQLEQTFYVVNVFVVALVHYFLHPILVSSLPYFLPLLLYYLVVCYIYNFYLFKFATGSLNTLRQHG